MYTLGSQTDITNTTPPFGGSVAEWFGRQTWNPDLLWSSAGFVLWLNSSIPHVHSHLLYLRSVGSLNLLSLSEFMITVRDYFSGMVTNQFCQFSVPQSTINITLTFTFYGTGQKRVKKKCENTMKRRHENDSGARNDQLSLFFKHRTMCKRSRGSNATAPTLRVLTE